MKWIVFVLMIAGLGYMFYISRDALERQLKSQSISPEKAAYTDDVETKEDVATLEALQNT